MWLIKGTLKSIDDGIHTSFTYHGNTSVHNLSLAQTLDSINIPVPCKTKWIHEGVWSTRKTIAWLRRICYPSIHIIGRWLKSSVGWWCYTIVAGWGECSGWADDGGDDGKLHDDVMLLVVMGISIFMCLDVVRHCMQSTYDYNTEMYHRRGWLITKLGSTKRMTHHQIHDDIIHWSYILLDITYVCRSASWQYISSDSLPLLLLFSLYFFIF